MKQVAVEAKAESSVLIGASEEATSMACRPPLSSMTVVVDLWAGRSSLVRKTGGLRAASVVNMETV